VSSLNRTSEVIQVEMRTIDTQPSFSEALSSKAPSSKASFSKAPSLRRRIVALALAISIGLAAASPAFADRYDKRRAGFPLRIVAYVVYPIGALLDVLIMRPAHWLGSQEPFKSAVGHED